MSPRTASAASGKPASIEPRRIVAGGLVTLTVIALAALFSSWPTYRTIPEGTAMLRLAFSHGGVRGKHCRTLSPEEIAALAPNMRRKKICERRRPPVYVELDIDGRTVLARELPPTGLAGDGPSRVYEKFVLPAGEHRIAVRLRDTDRREGFDHVAERRVMLKPEQNFVIDFRPNAGGFIFS